MEMGALVAPQSGTGGGSHIITKKKRKRPSTGNGAQPKKLLNWWILLSACCVVCLSVQIPTAYGGGGEGDVIWGLLASQPKASQFEGNKDLITLPSSSLLPNSSFLVVKNSFKVKGNGDNIGSLGTEVELVPAESQMLAVASSNVESVPDLETAAGHHGYGGHGQHHHGEGSELKNELNL